MRATRVDRVHEAGRAHSRGVPVPLALAHGAEADRHRRHAELHGGERSTDGAREQNGATEIRTGVDSRHEQVRRRPKSAEDRRERAQPRRSVDGVRLDAEHLFDLARLVSDLARQMQRTERGAEPRVVASGGDDDDLVAARVEGPGE